MLLCAWLPPAVYLHLLPPSILLPSLSRSASLCSDCLALVWFHKVMFHCALFTTVQCDLTGPRWKQLCSSSNSRSVVSRRSLLFPSYFQGFCQDIWRSGLTSRYYFTFLLHFTWFAPFFLSSPVSSCCLLSSLLFFSPLSSFLLLSPLLSFSLSLSLCSVCCAERASLWSPYLSHFDLSSQTMACWLKQPEGRQ